MNYVSDVIADGLARGGLRLILDEPPRHGKSEEISHWTPAWFLANWPTKRVILASYEATFAASWGRKVRNTLLENPDMGVRLAPDVQATSGWETVQGGGMVTAGVGGPITGRGADCLPAGTLVTTNAGPIPIEQLQFAPSSCKILTYDTQREELQWKTAEAWRVRPASGLYRVRTASGRVVEATENHLFWTSEGYKPARALTSGDSLVLLVPQAVPASRIRNEKAHQERTPGHLLFSGLCSSAPRDQKPSALSCLQQTYPREDKRLLRRVSTTKVGQEAGSPGNSQAMPDVQCGVQGGVARTKGRSLRSVLQQGLCQSGPFQGYVQYRESQVEKWGYATATTAAFCQGIPNYATADFAARRLRLCRMQDQHEASCPSLRQLADEQCSFQSGDALFIMPQEGASRVGVQAAYDTVAVVERVHQDVPVYDIQVADNHNFFANGILVHNCLIIDDPVKNEEEARSPVHRENIWQWWLTTARTRLEPGGSVIIVMTRWDIDDLAGRLLRDGTEQWIHISLPAIAEKQDLIGRAEGEALWPERYAVDALAKTRRDVGEDAWASLYQQRPNPAGRGLYFDVDAATALLMAARGMALTETRLGGLVRIKKRRMLGARYVMGGDCAWGEKGAFAVSTIMDYKTGEHVAELYGRPPLDELADINVKLCREYNDAYAGVERNGEGEKVCAKMVELGYGSRMYFHDHDQKAPKQPGWLTQGQSGATRSVMLADLEEAIRLPDIAPFCPDGCGELLTFVRDEKGRPGPRPGSYADHVMSWAIARQMQLKYARFGSQNLGPQSVIREF